MWSKLTLKKIIAIVKLSLFITWCWPLPKDTIKLKVICAGIYQCFSLIVTGSVAAGLINAVRNHFDDPVVMAKSISVLCPAVQVICNIVCCKVNSYRLQLVTFEMESFCELLKPREEAVVQRYIDKCVYFYGGSIFWIYLSCLFIIFGPITLDQPFPTNAEYPFNIYRQPIKSIIFIQQTIACLQGAAQLCMPIFMALLLWFSSARFEILVEKLQEITNNSELKKCIREHQNLLKYTEEVVILVRPFALTSVWLSTIALIIVGLIMLADQPLLMKIQCVGIIFSGLSVVFMYTWPAEHLIHISDEIEQAVFYTEWYQQPIALRKALHIVMLRAQKPVTVSVPCVMPALSLKYYASYLSTIFSYFTTLRVAMQNV
ncbi:odorant receptor Or2-like isoform X1 [Temnothorax longispinosus]|uniref:odorant receptor Or2-like isoform X1 n=2 Tax=Temnothorax longispinosus TaxID=300112 RepID=UPI003A99AA3C